jgi:hypothetical protein
MTSISKMFGSNDVVFIFCSIRCLELLSYDAYIRFSHLKIYIGGECDTRFLFCACAISSMLNDWSGVNKDSAVDYIKKCLTYEGGISLIPGNQRYHTVFLLHALSRSLSIYYHFLHYISLILHGE